MVTYAELPDDVNSRLANTSVYTFNDLTTGTHENVVWSNVGIFDRLAVRAGDAYGGAVDPGYPGGSNYSVQADFAGVTTTELTFFAPHAYFGLWWSAGDNQNLLRFYDGEVLVGEFTTATLLDRIAGDPEYRGNPRDRSVNYGESYAFINFFGMDGTTWDRVELSNGAGTGFEADNYTDREAAWNPATDGPMPGKLLAIVNGTEVSPIPEPGAALLSLIALPLALFSRRRRP